MRYYLVVGALAGVLCVVCGVAVTQPKQVAVRPYSHDGVGLVHLYQRRTVP